MNRTIKPISAAGFLALALSLPLSLAAADLDEFKVKRQEVFEFTEKPTIRRGGDTITIRFASKAFCDATVAIENADGKIVRHLASGVLGPNAPPPFQKHSLAQAIVWDSKNDRGEYLDDLPHLTVRVSLGLKPQFERTLFWSPKKRTADAPRPRRLAAASEGVYVYDSGVGEHLRLFDHDGNYVRTIYPFPSDKIDQVQGLTRRTFPAFGRPVPVKWGVVQATLLNWNSQHPLDTWPAGGGHGVDGNFRIGVAATALAVGKGRVALAGERVNRFATDGSSGGMKVHGPGTGFEIVVGGPSWRGGGRREPAAPTSAAISPDGQWLYLAGYTWPENWDTAGMRRDWLHGVARLRLDGDEPAKVFVGSMKQGDAGATDGKFGVASCVACDGRGRVYVGDYMNDRIQVFDPDGTLVKSVPAVKPARIVIHPRTGDIYVLSWLLRCYLLDRAKDVAIPATLTRLGPLEDPKRIVQWELPIRRYVDRSPHSSALTEYVAELDLQASSPTLWLLDDGLRIFTLDKGELVRRRDFDEDVRKEVAQPRPPQHGRQRLYLNPKNEKLYVGEQHYPVAIHSKAVWDLVCLDPKTGRSSMVHMPCSAEDLAFDSDGRIYLRTITEFARYDPETWREMPFDYGIEMEHFGYQHGFAPVKGVLQTHGEPGPSGQIGGMSVSPKGHLAITVINRGELVDRRTEQTLGSVQKYDPPIYPGRMCHWEVHVFDMHGKPLYPDAVTGIGYINGLAMDKDDALYIQASARPGGQVGNAVFDPLADTLIKVQPGKTRIVTDTGPVPLKELPKRPPDVILNSGTRAWIEGLQWLYPGVGLCGKMRYPYGDCFCQADSRFALDYFARSFASETEVYDIVVLDSAGNVITRIGKYGNVDDGNPLIKEGGPAKTQAVGGDEVALMHALYLAVHTDRRLFIADIGNYRVLSVALGYHATETAPLQVAGSR